MADEKMADDKTPSAEGSPASDAKAAKPSPAAKAAPKAGAAPKAAKKEKPPALEDKPFTEFIEQHFIPSLNTAFQEKGIDDIQLTLGQQPLGVFGVSDGESYWHVKGKWKGGDRQFNIVFTKDDITSPKLFYLADKGAQPSTIEQFMGDERKINLDLLVLFTLMRLNGQKWLARN
ncbi:DUF2996 domain-containing protein [Nodosilinea sp. LEGE 07298]|uniref:DUF2996 domain-containing protein n=1 Tax=Nodosilinea sp. LEGE 07298 TaxID=2777970 RepID=UPI00187E46C3|nr:DUF2996 domain-containing protein [Nodosilinea sp. LEGE 07298]MBE9111098.1 DUF2996 domain-containing protein [Nodosilinea sp. LEGE 07298]